MLLPHNTTTLASKPGTPSLNPLPPKTPSRSPTLKYRHHTIRPVTLNSVGGNCARAARLAQCHVSPRAFRRTTCVRTRASSENIENTLAETASLDQLIDLMLQAPDDELVQLVAGNVMSCDQKFFMRLATRSDGASDEVKDRIAAVAGDVMRIMDKMVKQTESTMGQSSEVLQAILLAGADETTGEFTVPLEKEKVESMRKVMELRGDLVDESVVANAYAYIRKASDDGLDGMVSILQTVLQLYAARTLASPKFANASAEGVAQDVNKVLSSDVDKWDEALAEIISGDYGEEAFMQELQKRMENVVLGMANGSYSQRVLAEYLKEVEERASAAFKSAST